MKKYIREILEELKITPGRKQAAPAVPEDLNNQILSKDPLRRLRQLDQRAQRNEEQQTIG